VSFGSILKTIGSDILKVVGVASGVAPLITAVLPAFIPMTGIAATIATKVAGWVATAEQFITTAQSGVQKQTAVSTIALQELPAIDEVIAAFGANAQIDPTKLTAAINAWVAVYNATQDLVANGIKPATSK